LLLFPLLKKVSYQYYFSKLGKKCAFLARKNHSISQEGWQKTGKNYLSLPGSPLQLKALLSYYQARKHSLFLVLFFEITRSDEVSSN
jgi:hypothetical protein